MYVIIAVKSSFRNNHAPLNRYYSNSKRNFNARKFIFGKHNKYEPLNEFIKFVCNNIINIGVI